MRPRTLAIVAALALLFAIATWLAGEPSCADLFGAPACVTGRAEAVR